MEITEQTAAVQDGVDIDESKVAVPEEVSLLPLKEFVLFPAVVMPLVVTREASIKLIDDAAVGNNRVIGVVTLRDPNVENPAMADIHRVGCLAAIRMMVRMPDGVRLIVQGLQRIRVDEPVQEEPYLRARITALEDAPVEGEEAGVEVQAMARNIAASFQKMVQMHPNLPDELQAIPMNVTEPSQLADLIAAHLPIPTPEKQEILEETSVRERLRRLLAILHRELNVLEVGNRIQSEVSTEMGKMQREYYLREQLKAIQKELGEGDERTAELDELREKIAAAGMPEEVGKEALRELDRLSKMPPAAAEYTVSRTYIDWLVSLPWNKSTVDNLDIAAVRAVLDEDHYGLERIKDRILEYLSVRKFRPEGRVRHPILCFVGPPGVGKTSLGRSIARALGRKFVRISLGGIRDEAEIRGHRRTYIGALPGQIIQGIRRAETNNPLFMLDEIDKVGADFRGDPSSALLEVLDPEQNIDFRDHYLDVPVDLSRVLFVTTANRLDTILPPLRDRMEIIELAGYTEEEKVEIAKRHLIPKQLDEHGLETPRHLSWEDGAIHMLIRGYTREAGVRSLEREIASVTRKATREFAEGRSEPIVVTTEQIVRYLGAPRFEYEEVLDRVSHAGVATGLAWTPVGGDVLFVEGTAMPGRGSLMITGQIGDVMRESAQAAMTFVRSHAAELGVDPGFFRRHDIHIHVPAGAIPKDGPSAGVTMVTAIASLATGRRERPRVAMTGEITLTGRVLPVGGIKEKVLAARRAGIQEIILPERNRRDVEEDVPAEIRSNLQFHFVRAIEEVLSLALEPTTEPAETDLSTARRWTPSLESAGASRNREAEE
jgi:ATP-dependent Lon protease